MARDELQTVTDRAVFIHPGFVRTATSTLQRHVFSKHPQIHFLGLPSQTPDLEWAVRHICQADSVLLEPERLQQVLAADLAGASKEQTALVSYENYALYESTDKGVVADRLRQLFPEGRILFTIRRQEDVVRSWYFTKLRWAIKRKSFIPFEEWYWLGAREPWRSILADLRYFRTIDRYVRLFGVDRVRVFPFEGLAREPTRFAFEMARFLDVDSDRFSALMKGKQECRAMSRRYFFFWRHAHPLLPRKLVRKFSMRMRMHGGPPAYLVLPDSVRTHIASLVAEDNVRLAEMYKLDLAALGYTMETRDLGAGPARLD